MASFVVICVILYSCKKQFLDEPPLGSLTSTQLASKSGVDGLLIGAYSLLDGEAAGAPFFKSSVSNWIYGDVASDDSHKGSQDGDNPDIATLEAYASNASMGLFDEKWQAVYDGISRSNDVLRELPLVKDGSVTPAYATEVTAEARFLRGIYTFEAVKMWRNVPYVDETISYNAGNYNVTNTVDAYPKIEADFAFAIANLPATQPQVGRGNLWAAKSFLAKVYMFEHKYVQAKALLTDIIANGQTSNGLKYALGNFEDNFNATTKNGPESVFAVQMTVHDGSQGANGNNGDFLNQPVGGPSTCCGFNQPSFSLVNSYKTDANGLPLLDTWNDSDITNDQGLTSDQPFTPYTGNLDPRLDWTVGRRGIPYRDWGPDPGAAWVRSQSEAGPYIPIKNTYNKSDAATTSDATGGWAAGQATSNNFEIIRFADVILWAAECEVEVGSLQQAENYVNMVRNRAANPAGWVQTTAAHYVISPYNGQFTANGQDYARKAVRFERKLELAMEGTRFFDLQRYDNGTGYMADVLNAYIQHETHIPGFNYTILNGAKFTKGKNEIYPIPQAEIDLEKGALKQNPGY